MRPSSYLTLLVLLMCAFVSFLPPSYCGQLFYSTDTDEGSAIFSIDTASPENGPVWVRNTSEPIRQFAVDGLTSTLYYVARGITYATGLAPDSEEEILFPYHDVRALRLVHENASPVLYFTGCNDDDDGGEQQTQARLQASKRDSCNGVLLWRVEPGSGQPYWWPPSQPPRWTWSGTSTCSREPRHRTRRPTWSAAGWSGMTISR